MKPHAVRITHRLARSYLFVPGNRPDRFDKAAASAADAIIVDLEDAVPPADKAAARAALAAWLTPSSHVVVRVNGADTEWFADDVALCAHPGVAGVVVPKAESEDHLAHVASRVASHAVLLPLIESAKGLVNGAALAGAPRVLRVLFGSIDFQLDLRMSVAEADLLFFRQQLVLLSRAAGIAAPVDGVTVEIDDAAVLRDAAAHARRLGFGGKLCIHPAQAAIVNDAFSPTADEIAWARRIVAAADAAGGAATAVDGRMVDKPVILRAQAILANAGPAA